MSDIPEEELWSVDHALAKWIAPRLRGLAAISHGPPEILNQECNGDTVEAMERWKAILIEMAEGFEAFLAGNGWTNVEQYENAASLLGQWFGHLWD